MLLVQSLQQPKETDTELSETSVHRQTEDKRIIAKKGREFVIFRFEQVAYFYIENGLSYLVDTSNHAKYIMAKPLREIEEYVKSKYFFRVNKKYLININAVVKFKPLKKGKLQLVVNPDPNETIIISQLKAQLFKEWVLQN
jgi:two-component system LytT family response regulator